MLKITPVWLLLLISNISWANPINQNCPEHAHPAGAPVSTITTGNQYICHLNYAVHFRYDTKVAEYVTYRIDAEDISGAVPRRDNFRPDPEIPAEFNAALSDYAGSGYDRGHLSPAADNSASAEQMAQSFYLSNMAPQNPSQNRGSWRILEDRVRRMAGANPTIYVTVGTHYEPGYETVGAGLGIPQYLWKLVVHAESHNAIVFWFPNVRVSTAELPDLVISVAELEARTGLNFHPDLGQPDWESVVDTAFWSGLLGR